MPRYMQTDNCGDDAFREQDNQNRIAVKTYLEGIRAMELMAANELKIATLEKHQEIIDEIGGPSVPAEIKGIRIGDCALIALEDVVQRLEGELWDLKSKHSMA